MRSILGRIRVFYIAQPFREFDGLSSAIAKLLGGIDVPVDTNGFSNDLITFHDQDDVLTLLIHLGYLAYDEKSEMVHIPNEEIRLEFARSIRKVKQDDTIRRVYESEEVVFYPETTGYDIAT